MVSSKYSLNPEISFYKNLRNISKECEDENKFDVSIKKHFYSLFDTTEFKIKKIKDDWQELYFNTSGFFDKKDLNDSLYIDKNYLSLLDDFKDNISELKISLRNSDLNISRDEQGNFCVYPYDIIKDHDNKPVFEDLCNELGLSKDLDHQQSENSFTFTDEKSITKFNFAKVLSYLHNRNIDASLSIKSGRTELSIYTNPFILNVDIKNPQEKDIDQLEELYNRNAKKPLKDYDKIKVSTP